MKQFLILLIYYKKYKIYITNLYKKYMNLHCITIDYNYVIQI